MINNDDDYDNCSVIEEDEDEDDYGDLLESEWLEHLEELANESTHEEEEEKERRSRAAKAGWQKRRWMRRQMLIQARRRQWRSIDAV